MQRRKLLKTIAAGGALSLGVSGSANAVQVDIEEIEDLKLIRDGEVVEQIQNPDDEQFKQLDAMRGDGEFLRVKEDCSTYCATDCQYVCDGTCHFTHTCSDTQWCCA